MATEHSTTSITGGHANAVASGAAGFMSGTDKAKLDGIAANAAALTSNAPANVGTTAAVGSGTAAAKDDHVHDLTFATWNAVAAEASAAISVNSQKISALAAPATTADAANRNYADLLGDTYLFTYLTDTADSDPGNGGIKFNSTTLASIVTAYIDLLDANGNTLTTWIDNMTQRGGGSIRMVKKSDPSVSVTFTLRNWTTASGYRKLTLRYIIDSGGSFANNDLVLIQFINTPINGRGTNLDNTSETKTPTVSADKWVMPPATTSATRAKTAGTGSVTAGMTATFIIWPQGHDVTIVDGGTGTPTLFTITAGDGAVVSLRFDGTHWSGSREALG